MTTRVILAVLCAPAGALVGFTVGFGGAFALAEVGFVGLDSPLASLLAWGGALSGAALVVALVIGPRKARR